MATRVGLSNQCKNSCEKASLFPDKPLSKSAPSCICCTIKTYARVCCCVCHSQHTHSCPTDRRNSSISPPRNTPFLHLCRPPHNRTQNRQEGNRPPQGGPKTITESTAIVFLAPREHCHKPDDRSPFESESPWSVFQGNKVCRLHYSEVVDTVGR